ncbi:uncharacterized protein UV8b_01963 [Ustilaginoidea virens]|uniref:Deacetylase sirtuin-type domain-containing protein n=1 Tax=Ustilaginoidea virens TaxID=1159556 RepID=A0A063C044_USTVR|nr:uncharacterized protein UV8b_01963 [Ustilaginoidea virens]QUC17722.1 hypothetical protein UV8b_01963 [Ustilaginoidea virens]GAO13964.1 hypothetical protein UVI_02035180 [Ustilaginoidea virens]
MPSSPLSSLPQTPSAPGSPAVAPDAACRYPSPSSTAVSGTQSPIKLAEPADDCSPPAKKRRTTPRERITTYLDLMKPHEEFSREDNFHMERLLSALRKKKKIVVVAGAGISVSAGIPDFRSATGLFATQRSQHKVKASGKHLFDASVYKHESSTTSFHTMVREMSEMSKKAQPTPFHHLLASLAQEGRLLRLYSQNIDCIDTSMKPLQTQTPLEPKAPWPTTIQLHGSLDKMVCTKCADIQPFQSDLFDGPEAPLCESCRNLDEVRTAHAGKRSHGIGRLRPRFVLYNEFNPDEEAIGNIMRADLRARPDAVLVVGTTLKVPGTRRLVKEMCQVTRGRKDGLTAWINIDSEPKVPDFKDSWDLVVKSKCDNIARLAALPPWDCEIGDSYLVSNEEEREMSATPPTKLEVLLDGKPRQHDDVQAIPTPQASPPPPPRRKPLPMSKQTSTSLDKEPKLTKSGKIGKRPGRKPKQPAKTEPRPPNPFMKAFKPSKKLSDADSGKKVGTCFAPADGKPPTKQSRTGLPSSSSRFADKTSLEITVRVMAPESPPTPTTPEHQQRETISPTSIPNNMLNLIDVA